ncbi:MAG TPA: hypothetical protein VNJ04_02630 [Gemmatimonadaceae bacterium]|nr:hypothetical protein [Gemmatimonadaceae bacterium]
MTPLGPELRFMMRRSDKQAGEEDLLWSMIFRPEDGGGLALGDAADDKRREFLALGWMADPDAYADSVIGQTPQG